MSLRTTCFSVDPLDPKQVLMKGGILVKTAIMERSTRLKMRQLFLRNYLLD